MSDCARLLSIAVVIVDHDAITALSHERLRAYLESHGWSEAYRIGDKAITFKRGVYFIDCPLRADLGDYASRMYDAVAALADQEGRSQLLVYADLMGVRGPGE